MYVAPAFFTLSPTNFAVDDCPPRAKGFISGLVQQGYALGYLLAVVFTRAIADTQKHHWRAMFWFASGILFLFAVFRSLLPQTDAYKRKQLEKRIAEQTGVQVDSFEKKAGKAMKVYWLMLIYMILLMAGFNFMSHGSQDLYPTFLTEQLGFGNDRSTVTNCVANLGAITGGLIIGHASNFAGRRLSIIVCCVGGGALIYPWAFVRNTGINAAVFFMQFFVQGAFGVIPAHLLELAHPEFRSFVVGVAYQLGNLASSASSTIESTIGERFKIMGKNGSIINNYGLVMAIFMGCVFGFVLLVTFVGPENRAIDQEQEQTRNAAVFMRENKDVEIHQKEDASVSLGPADAVERRKDEQNSGSGLD